MLRFRCLRLPTQSVPYRPVKYPLPTKPGLSDEFREQMAKRPPIGWRLTGLRVQPVATGSMVLVTDVVDTEAVVAVADVVETEATVAVTMDWLAFLKAGNAKFSLSADGKTYTYTMKAAKPCHQRPDCHFFVDLVLTHAGTADVGRIGSDDVFRPAWSNLQSAKPAVALFAKWWTELTQGRPTLGFDAKHIGACGRCGRALEDPVSVAAGIGPDCWRYVFGVSRKAAKKEKLKATAVDVEPIYATSPAAEELPEADQKLFEHFLVIGGLRAKYTAAKADMRDADAVALEQLIRAAHEQVAYADPDARQLRAIAKACVARATLQTGVSPLPSRRQEAHQREVAEDMVAAALTAAGIAGRIARELESLKKGEAA